MKSPRFLAALAMAAVLTTGTTAHAAFNQVGGSATNGQIPMQEAEEFDPTSGATLDATGDISLDGTFTKRINNFPTPTTDGHYLRITMPIKMDYTYDVDTNVMQSTDMVVTNNSVHATQTGQASTTQLDYKKVKMTIVDFKENAQGITTMTPNVKFVEDVAKEALNDKNNVLLPFELQVKSPSGSVDNFSIQKIQAPTTGSTTNGLNPIEIAPNSALTLKLEQINGQTIGNKDLISQQTSKTSHNLKLKFEYVAN